MFTRDTVQRLAVLIALCLALFSFRSGAQELVFQSAPAVPELTRRMLLDITRAGDRLIAVGASGLIIVSDDSGSSWRQAEVPVSATLTAVDFPTPTHGWAVGHAGVILHSADGGESWTLQFDGREANAALLAYATDERNRLESELDALEAAGDTPRDELDDLQFRIEDAIFLQEDAQIAIETGPADPLLDVEFSDDHRGLAAGAYGMFLRTEDGGNSWELAIEGLDNPGRYHLYGLLLKAGEEVYVAGEAGLLFRSADGGRSFERYYDVYEGSLFGVLEADSGIITYGLRGNQFRYDRDSDAWEAIATDFETSLYGAARLDDGDLLLLGAGGRILRRGGEPDDERAQLHPSRGTLSSGAVAPDGRVWLVGMKGLVSYAEATDQ